MIKFILVYSFLFIYLTHFSDLLIELIHDPRYYFCIVHVIFFFGRVFGMQIFNISTKRCWYITDSTWLTDSWNYVICSIFVIIIFVIVFFFFSRFSSSGFSSSRLCSSKFSCYISSSFFVRFFLTFFLYEVFIVLSFLFLFLYPLFHSRFFFFLSLFTCFFIFLFSY